VNRSCLAAVLVGLGVLAVGACSSGSGSSPTARASSSTAVSGHAPTLAASSGEAVTPTPLSAGPTTVTQVESCPFATNAVVRDTMGMRLGKVTLLKSGGKVIGCRFYALQSGPLHTSERLPGPNQPVVEITTQRYSNAFNAYNAFVLRAQTGTNLQRVTLGAATGVCFQNDFYPKDKGADWACTVNKRAKVALVRTVDTTGTFSTAALLTTVLRAV
jgi:hypothetical protein